MKPINTKIFESNLYICSLISQIYIIMGSKLKFYFEEKYNPVINEHAFNAQIKSVEYSSAPKPFKGLRLGCITFENELKGIDSKAITLENSQKFERIELPHSIISLKADSLLTKILVSDLYDAEGNLIIDGKLIRKKNTKKGKYLEGPKEIPFLTVSPQ